MAITIGEQFQPKENGNQFPAHGHYHHPNRGQNHEGVIFGMVPDPAFLDELQGKGNGKDEPYKKDDLEKRSVWIKNEGITKSRQVEVPGTGRRHQCREASDNSHRGRSRVVSRSGDHFPEDYGKGRRGEDQLGGDDPEIG